MPFDRERQGISPKLRSQINGLHAFYCKTPYITLLKPPPSLNSAQGGACANTLQSQSCLHCFALSLVRSVIQSTARAMNGGNTLFFMRSIRAVLRTPIMTG